MKFDFHIHSIYSKDSILKPERIVKIAKKEGFSGVAITDHDTIRGALKTKSIVQDNLEVIIGSEVKTDKGEIIGLFLNEEIKSRNFLEVIEEIRDQDGISVLPHPYRNRLFESKDILGMIDLVEGLNGRTSKELNYRAQELAKNHRLPMIAGSDAHTPFEIGRVMNILQENDDIKKCILKGNVTLNGKELPHHLRIFSSAIGRYKRDGIAGLAASFINRISNKKR
ncbi:Error-prone DNA polymerase [uncultured archaeon]|nr:Error-prone DNA polymerase [uncultured archaeon]